VDVRYNGGGAVSGLLLQKLARRRMGYDFSRWGPPAEYPATSPRGPMAAVTNEWAGSDGDIFSHTFKLMKLGPLIGKRTWGGVIGINPRHALADNTITTQPEFSFFFDDVHWGVENYGTDPDIEVDNAPQDYARGADPQLDRAIGDRKRTDGEREVDVAVAVDTAEGAHRRAAADRLQSRDQVERRHLRAARDRHGRPVRHGPQARYRRPIGQQRVDQPNNPRRGRRRHDHVHALQGRLPDPGDGHRHEPANRLRQWRRQLRAGQLHSGRSRHLSLGRVLRR